MQKRYHLDVASGLDQLLTDLPSEVILLHSPGGQIHFASHTAPMVFGEGTAVAHTNLFDHVHEADRVRLRNAFTESALKATASSPLTVRLSLPHGIQRWVVAHTQAVRDAAGHVIELHTTLRDVTGQVDLRDRIVEKDTLSHMTNVLAKVGGWYYDIATERYFWSDEVRKIHEVDDDFIPTNDSVSALFTSKDMQAITDATASVVETGTPQVLETATTTSKGNERWLRIFISASFDRGTAVRIYGATQDISEIREREEEMEKLVKELTIQRDLLEEFGSLISHQLRGPLTNLATIADLLVETTDDEERWRLMQALRESVKGMDRTLEEVSDAVHVRRRVHTKSERIDVARLIDSVTKELAPSILEIGASIDVDTSQLPEIVYPVVYFESIVRQLVTNALRFAHADRPLRVHLCTMTHSGDPLLTVRDNGMGMDLGKHGSRLFRLGSTFHKHSSGRGVGLFMVRSIVESLGGEILVESEAGVGTAFTVNLRTHDAEAT